MKRRTPPKSVARPKRGALEDLIEQITVDAYGDAEQLWAFRQAFEDDLTLPCAATIAGARVTVVKFDFDGNERRGLNAKCRLQDGSQQTISAADVQFVVGDPGELYVTAYRKMDGLAALSRTKASSANAETEGSYSAGPEASGIS